MDLVVTADAGAAALWDQMAAVAKHIAAIPNGHMSLLFINLHRPGDQGETALRNKDAGKGARNC
jgi:hypothetical protein